MVPTSVSSQENVTRRSELREGFLVHLKTMIFKCLRKSLKDWSQYWKNVIC